MKLFLACLSLVLAIGVIGAIDANQPYEEVKPFTFQVIQVPVSSGYVETEYNLKPVYINCSVNERDADIDLFESIKSYRDYQKLCVSSHKRAIESFERLCTSQLYESPFSRPKSVESHPEDPSISADRFDFTKLSKRRIINMFDHLPESWSLDQKFSFLWSLMEIHSQYRAALRLSSELNDLSPQLITKHVSAKELLGIFDFSSLTNVTEYAEFHKFKNCNQLNATDPTFKVKLVEANVVPTKKIIKLDAFRYLDSDKCLVSYVGPERFVYDSSNQTYCPLKMPLYKLVNENKTLDDECRTSNEPNLLFLRNCSAQLDPKDLIQVKAYEQFYYIYCYGSEVKFNDDAPIKCPNSVLRTSLNNTVSINGRVVSYHGSNLSAFRHYSMVWRTLVKFDDETNQKLIQIFQQTITSNSTLSE